MLKWFKKLLGRYDDYEECGTWGSFNVETGEVTQGGKMFSRTIKVENEDGSMGLDSEWITDADMEHEKETGEQVGPASDTPPNSDDPTTAADWWKK